MSAEIARMKRLATRWRDFVVKRRRVAISTMLGMLRIARAGGVTALIWAAAYNWVSSVSPPEYKSSGGMETLLFGASSIALFIVSVWATLAPVLGWQAIRASIDEAVEKAASRISEESKAEARRISEETKAEVRRISEEMKAEAGRISEELKVEAKQLSEEMKQAEKVIQDQLQKELMRLADEVRGRFATGLGYLTGELGLKKDSFKARDMDRLELAVSMCEVGLDHLKRVGGAAEFMGWNNWLFFKCVMHARSQNAADEDSMLKAAEKVMAAGKEHNATLLKLTAARVFLECKGATDAEKREAWEILQELVARTSRISRRERKEALCYLSDYPDPNSPPAPSAPTT